MPTKKKTVPKRRNAQDITLRNLRALRKAMVALDRRVQSLERQRAS